MDHARNSITAQSDSAESYADANTATRAVTAQSAKASDGKVARINLPKRRLRLRVLLPATERFGIVDPKEVQIDTLAARLRDEVVAANATILLPLLVGAWGTKTGSASLD